MKHVIVGLSGGVDSSVAALLLQQQGYHVSALFMKNWEEDDTSTHCSATVDLKFAQAVCDHLKIELHTVNFAAEYWDHVFEDFLTGYKAGYTPNPDILCNKEIKFNLFLRHAKTLGADYIATGHYARIQRGADGYELHKALDTNKDQSYFLHAVSAAALAVTKFPLGMLCKAQVRQIAREHHLPTAAKKDSTGICFIGERKFKSFLQTYLPAQPGEIITSQGVILGQHDGLMYYTIGQRQGLAIGGRQNYPPLPWYVVAKDISRNQLIVAQGQEAKELYADRLCASTPIWIIKPPVLPLTTSAKIRYRQLDQPCLLTRQQKSYEVAFTQAQRAITPGQSIVFYQNTHCLGGAVIQQALSEHC